MERFESRAENEEQVLSAVYRRYKEEYVRRCLEDGRLERILSLREFIQWLRTQPEGFFAEVELKERGLAGAVIQLAEKCQAAARCIHPAALLFLLLTIIPNLSTPPQGNGREKSLSKSAAGC